MWIAFSVSYTCKKQLSEFSNKTNTIISLRSNLLSQCYSWHISQLALHNNHSLIIYMFDIYVLLLCICLISTFYCFVYVWYLRFIALYMFDIYVLLLCISTLFLNNLHQVRLWDHTFHNLWFISWQRALFKTESELSRENHDGCIEYALSYMRVKPFNHYFNF
jgi:hypothetical protein